VSVQSGEKLIFSRFLFSQVRVDQDIQETEANAHILCRQMALEKERMRAQQVASLPPPVKTDLKELLGRAKAAYVQVGCRLFCSEPFKRGI